MPTINYSVPEDIDCPECGFTSKIDQSESDKNYLYVTYVCLKCKHVFTRKYRKA
jgi:DNA-directed RNA polymerase subunit RPC12/RpoP